MAVNPISQRYPFELRDQSPEVVQAHRYAFQGIVDLNQAIASLKSQLDAKTVTTVTTTSTSGGAVPIPFPFAGLGAVNDLTGVTVYTTVANDSGILLVLNDASPVAVSLDSALSSPFFCFITNFGAGLATLTPTAGTVNGAASYALPQNYFAMIVFDGVNWFTSAEFLPQTFSAISHQWLRDYSAVTGLFTAGQPAFADISGVASTAQIGTGTPAAGKYVDGGTGAWTALPVSTPGYTPTNVSTTATASAGQAIFCTTTGAGFTVTLPAASANSGKSIIVKKVSADGNTLTVGRTGGDVIDGATTVTTTTQYFSWTFLSDGVSNWWIV